MSKEVQYPCPLCVCTFSCNADLQKHLDTYGRDDKVVHLLNIERARKEAERPGRFQKV